MLQWYLKIWEWEWIFGRAVKAISSPGVRSPWWELLAKKSILCTIVFKRSILIYLTVILSGLRNCLFSDAQLFFLSGFFLYFLVSYLVHKFLYGVIIINYDTIIFYIRYIRYLILSIPVFSCLFLSVSICFRLFPSVSVCFFPIWGLNFFKFQFPIWDLNFFTIISHLIKT
jgi:hypothetical protein